jgi:hypothetical protein
MNNVMLDLETLGVTPNSIILSIGAVEFDESNLGDVFHMGIDYEDQVKRDMHVDASTAMWWLGQDQAAQQALLKITAGALSLPVVLTKFAAAFKNWDKKRLWCNGASFDIPLLVAAHKKSNLIQPWRYSNEMDMRTIKGLFGKEAWKLHAEKPTVAHDGLADAIAQARSLQRVLQELGDPEWLK